ncbi:MAG: class I SAM-dependent methyltransferase [Candidatus Liptonbacteria bacterium]|nr:class I SAM-dependent methyltransferase [Candidatus Liptonbacteria bacterium]
MELKAKHWEDMYARDIGTLPWEIVAPPQELAAALQRGNIPKGEALDVGCGTGNYSIYLTTRGFEVTGIDFSENALAVAKNRAHQKGINIKFVLADANNLAGTLNEKYDFIFDYSLLHHIADDDVQKYAAQFPSLLKPNGVLLLICYSEKDAERDEFAKGARTARGKYGNMMYYRTREEIEKLYSNLQEIDYKEARLGKRLHHLGHCFLFRKA